jgi:hypothetical protein
MLGSRRSSSCFSWPFAGDTEEVEVMAEGDEPSGAPP